MSKRTKAGPEEIKEAIGRYVEGGESIRAIAKSMNRSYGWVHSKLTNAGVQIRARGGSRPRRVPVNV